MIPVSHTYEATPPQPAPVEWVWEQADALPFNELIVSWNGFRPETGKWTIWISLEQKGAWSPWLKYAEWSADSQKTFKSCGDFAETYQDAAYPKEGLCTSFRIKAEAGEGADLSDLHAIFACASRFEEKKDENLLEPLPFVMLPFAFRQSQMTLDHRRASSLCSPASVTNALNNLFARRLVSPIDFAEKIWDGEFDIFGNWILNTAQAYHEAKGAFRVHVERLGSFSDIHAYLRQELPVVVSIRGPISGSAQPYESGHLVCVIGYDPNQARVYCIDPAFPDDASTLASYPLEEFLAAWERRGYIAYVFPRRT
jgi:hypothetical protein